MTMQTPLTLVESKPAEDPTPVSDTVESRLIRIETCVDMLKDEHVKSRDEMRDSLRENTAAINTLLVKMSEREKQAVEAASEIKSIWAKLGSTPQGKAALTAGLLTVGGVLLKIIEAVPGLLEASRIVQPLEDLENSRNVKRQYDVLKAVLTGVDPSWRANANRYLALHTADPGEGGDQTTSEATYTSYARIAISTSDWTDGGSSFSNASLKQFPQCTGGSNTITHVSIGTASSGAGQILYSGALNSSLAVSNLIQPQFAIGALVVTEDLCRAPHQPIPAKSVAWLSLS